MVKQRVVIADDHPIVLQGLRSRLDARPELQIVGEVCDGWRLLDAIKTTRPNVLVLDISMPPIDGAELISAVKAQYPAVKIVVYTVHMSLPRVEDCFNRGVEGYVGKGDTRADILTAITQVGDGYYYLSPGLCKPLLQSYRTLLSSAAGGGSSWRALTPRERDIVRLSAQGLRAREIAKRLGITAKTVDNCRYRIRQKLDLPNQAALINYALQSGLLETDTGGVQGTTRAMSSALD